MVFGRAHSWWRGKRGPVAEWVLGVLVVGVVLALTLTAGVGASTANGQHGCAFIDTIAISGMAGGELRDAGNATHLLVNGSAWPRELISSFDFIVHNGVRQSVEPHPRLCVCRMRPCLRFCCPNGDYYDTHAHTCSSTATQPSVATLATPQQAIEQSTLRLMQPNGTQRTIETHDQFTVYTGAPCRIMRLVPKDNRLIQWSIFENGSIGHGGHLFPRTYCLSPHRADASLAWQWQPLACVPDRLPFVLGVKEWTYAISLIITVICMVNIFFIYLFSTELRNTFYGVAIKAYALCIIVGYSLLAHLTLTNPADMSRLSCSHIPSFALLFLVLSFCILTFISCNLYLNFDGVIFTKLMFWLLFCPIVLLAIGWAWLVNAETYEGKPLLGGADICWFNPRDLGIILYLYTPIGLASLLSVLFYTITLWKIDKRRDTIEPAIEILLNRFHSFWQFFLYTCLVWLVFAGSSLLGYYRGAETHANYVVSIFAAVHGFGALYALVGKNRQIQNCLQKIDDLDDEDMDSSIPMNEI